MKDTEKIFVISKEKNLPLIIHLNQQLQGESRYRFRLLISESLVHISFLCLECEVLLMAPLSRRQEMWKT